MLSMERYTVNRAYRWRRNEKVEGEIQQNKIKGTASVEFSWRRSQWKLIGAEMAAEV